VEDDFEALEAEEDAQFWQNAQIWPEETNSEDLSEQIMARETEVMPETQEIPETQDVSTGQSDQTYDRNSRETSTTSENSSTPLARKKIVSKPHEKRGVARSQLQAIGQLASGVNKLADVNAKRMKIEEKDREALLNFRKEEAEKTRQHEKDMAELYLNMMHIQRQPTPSYHPTFIPNFGAPRQQPISPFHFASSPLQDKN